MEYGNYFKDVVALNLPDLKSFNKSNIRLDDFFFKKMKMKDYPKLAYVAKLILCIGHGHAAVERGFNVNKHILQTYMQEKGLISQCMIYDHMPSKDLKPATLHMTRELVKSVMCSRIKYQIYLDDMKEEKVQSESDIKRDAIQNDMVAITSKKSDLEKSALFCRNITRNLLKKKDITYVVEANALQHFSFFKLF